MRAWWKMTLVAVVAVLAGCGSPEQPDLLPAPTSPEDAQMFRDLPSDEYRDYMRERQRP
ncbi:MAG: hypothetical protein OXG37_06210 [Actinomycetia bacterium]|nr:hypothetical protein [Actinomycetes bacterium]